jgi:uncharacterized protein YndB with AHSA1/START domain
MTGDERERRIELEVEVPGTPEEVWEAIATGPWAERLDAPGRGRGA